MSVNLEEHKSQCTEVAIWASCFSTLPPLEALIFDSDHFYLPLVPPRAAQYHSRLRNPRASATKQWHHGRLGRFAFMCSSWRQLRALRLWVWDPAFRMQDVGVKVQNGCLGQDELRKRSSCMMSK